MTQSGAARALGSLTFYTCTASFCIKL